MNGSTVKNIENYKALAGAIVKCAAWDYRHACRVKDKSRKSSLENFFRSDEFELFTSGAIDPEYLMGRLRKMAYGGME